MTVNFDWLMWLFATVCFGICALSAFIFRTPNTASKIGWMCLGFMFIAITFLTG